MEKVSQEIFRLLGDQFSLLDMEEINGGYLASAYKITAKHSVTNEQKIFFLKSLKTKEALTNELPEDVLHSYLAGVRANKLAATNCPKSYGCFVSSNESPLQKIDFHDDSNIFELQDFRSGSALLTVLKKYVEVGQWSYDLEKCIDSVAVMLSQIHSVKKEATKERSRQIYKRSVRDILCHPELTLSVFANNLEDSMIFSNGYKYEYITDMLKLCDTCTDGSRLSLIHGDFWYSNIMLDQDNSPFLIDYSRQGYGEPGIDVGWFFGSMLWLSIVEQNAIYKEIAFYFLESYKQHSGDGDIEKYATVPLGFIGAVCSIEQFYPDVTNVQRKQFVDFVHSCITMQTINHTPNF